MAREDPKSPKTRQLVATVAGSPSAEHAVTTARQINQAGPELGASSLLASSLMASSLLTDPPQAGQEGLQTTGGVLSGLPHLLGSLAMVRKLLLLLGSLDLRYPANGLLHVDL